MTYKTILAAASGGTASSGAIELGCRLANHFKAHLECFHARVDPRDIMIATAGDGFGGPFMGELMDKVAEEAAALALKTKAVFETAIARNKIEKGATPTQVGASAEWREETGYAPALVAARARFFDIAVLGRSERVVDQPHSDVVEQALLRSGRPVLLAPAKPPEAIGKTIAVGWNGSAETVHAISGARPLLINADRVIVIAIGERDADGTPQIADYLGWQGVKATTERVDLISGVGPGEQLLASARDAGADLLVMGAYGHMPWREALFGGATRQVVGTSLLPILLSH